MPRYAIYYSPAPHSLWAELGSRWLGRDAFTGMEVSHPDIPEMQQDRFSYFTKIARRYGFHATLKAPFRLKEGWSEIDLLNFASRFCEEESPLPVRELGIDVTQGFLAIRPLLPQPEISDFAFRCVRNFDCMRAPLTEEELDKQMDRKLSPRQMDLLRCWGYPYVDEEFQFHLTLSDDLSKADQESATMLYMGATQYFAQAIDSIPLVIDGISIFRVDNGGGLFKVIQRIPFVS